MTAKGLILIIPLFLLGSAVVVPVRADDRAVIAAATANAVDALRDDVNTARINARYTVADFLQKSGGTDELGKTLQRAEQIGGPRFSTDGQACQIKLEIEGDRVARELITIAASNPNKSPIPAEALARELVDWRTRVFSGTGTSVSGAKMLTFNPPAPDDAWADVSDSARQQAVNAARDNAVNRVMDAIRAVPLTAGRTVGDALNVQSVHDSVSSWLSSRPVRHVQFGSDHQVELTLAAPPGELCDQLLAAAKQAELALPDSPGQAKLKEVFLRLAPTAVGQASASAPPPTTAPVATVVLPNHPPAWTERPLSGEGVADSKGSKLKTARAAESAAQDAIRAKVVALPLSASLTVGDAEKQSPAIEKAVNQTISRARPYKVDYRADGSVLVRSTLNPRELWAAISDGQ